MLEDNIKVMKLNIIVILYPQSKELHL